jgi:hypothetical protein
MPSKIKVKICGYDELSNSVIVKFASDTTEKPIDDYQACAYQPTMFSVGDPESVIKEIARAGIFSVTEQERKEKFVKDIATIQKYQQYIGKEFEYDIETLIVENQIVEQYVEGVDDSEIDEILQDILIDDNETVDVNLDNDGK